MTHPNNGNTHAAKAGVAKLMRVRVDTAAQLDIIHAHTTPEQRGRALLQLALHNQPTPTTHCAQREWLESLHPLAEALAEADEQPITFADPFSPTTAQLAQYAAEAGNKQPFEEPQ